MTFSALKQRQWFGSLMQIRCLHYEGLLIYLFSSEAERLRHLYKKNVNHSRTLDVQIDEFLFSLLWFLSGSMFAQAFWSKQNVGQSSSSDKRPVQFLEFCLVRPEDPSAFGPAMQLPVKWINTLTGPSKNRHHNLHVIWDSRLQRLSMRGVPTWGHQIKPVNGFVQCCIVVRHVPVGL